MDVNAYLPMLAEALGGAVMAGLVGSVLGGRGMFAGILGAIAGVALGFWLETGGQLNAVAEAMGGGMLGFAGSAAAVGAAGGAGVALLLALIPRRKA